MGWRMVVQPNGKYARFSDVVDHFTDYDMTRDEAFILCRDLAGVETARHKLDQADKLNGRFEREIGTIRIVHGPEEAGKIRAELSK